MSNLPSQCAVALKEWATVLEAMAKGEQLVLIRKGGLIEPGRGFQLLAETFVFYPTFEHQAVNYLREPFRNYFEEAARRRPADGRIRIELVGQATSSTELRNPEVIERLGGVHIYNREFVTQRLKWQPDQPMMLVVVRAWRLAQPFLLEVNPRYAGCKSWVELDAAVSLDGVRPVLDDTTFHDRLQQVAAALMEMEA